MHPAECWLAAVEICQRDGCLQIPHNKRHSQLKRCPRYTSANKQPLIAITHSLPPQEDFDHHRVVILHLRAENFSESHSQLQASMNAQASSTAYLQVWLQPCATCWLRCLLPGEPDGEMKTYRVLFAIFTQHLWGNPPFSAWHAWPTAKAVPAHCQLLAQAEVWNHSFDFPMGVGHRDEDVMGLQVPVDCYKHPFIHSRQSQQY